MRLLTFLRHHTLSICSFCFLILATISIIFLVYADLFTSLVILSYSDTWSTKTLCIWHEHVIMADRTTWNNLVSLLSYISTTTRLCSTLNIVPMCCMGALLGTQKKLVRILWYKGDGGEGWPDILYTCENIDIYRWPLAHIHYFHYFVFYTYSFY